MPLHPLRESVGFSLVPEHERLPPAMDHQGGWIASQYSPAMARIILARMEEGESVVAIGADPCMPCFATIHHWRRAHPDFDAAFQEVRSDVAHFRRSALTRKSDFGPVWEAALARDAGRRPRRKPGRKSTYTAEVAEAYCNYVICGMSCRAASRQPGMPTAAVVHRWLKNHPEFRSTYVAALQFRDDMLCDQLLALAETATPANYREVRRQLNRLRQRITSMRPKVWFETV